MKQVELRLAYEWTCEECGRDNFHRGIKPSAESLDGQLDEEELEMLAHCEFVMRPTVVECPHCKSRFDVEDDDDG